MGSVWQRLQRAGKGAARVRFEATLEELLVEGGGGWTPDRLTVVWSRRHRRVCSKPRRWQPGIQNPQRGMVVWVVPETLEVVVTLYRDPQAATFDDKSWTFLVVNESRGRRSVLAAAPLELGRLAGVADAPLSLSLRPRSRRVTAATLRVRLRGVLLREGHPTDEDMRSITSLSPPGDVADLGDFESDPEDEGGARRVGGAPPAPPALPPRGDPPALGTPEPGGDPEPPPEISAGPPGGRGALLAWCRGVTAGYPGVAITDFGGSWSSGLGFCALLHRLRPQEIDFDALDPRDPRGNNKRAFDAFAALGVPRLLDPSDMETPDSLGVMTFLSQVRALLGTPPGTPPRPRSDVIDGGPQMSPPETPQDPRSDVTEEGPPTTPPGTLPDPQNDVTDEGPQMTPPETPQSDVTKGGTPGTPPGSPPDPRSGSSREGPQEPPRDPQTPPETQPGTPPEPQETPPDPPQLGPSEGGAPPDPQLSPPLEEPPRDPQTDTAEGGRPQTPPPSPPRDDPPQNEPPESDPPQNEPPEAEPPQLDPPRDPQLGPVEGGPPQDAPPAFGEGAAAPVPPPRSPRPAGVGRGLPTPPPRSRSLPRLRDPDPRRRRSGRGRDPPPQGDIGTPPATPGEPPEPPEEESGWVAAELAALEQQQAGLDARAPELERELRELLESGADPAREERLLREWFALVQQRNVLVRRQDELQLLAQERDLERRFELLSRELRGLLGTEEWQKPPAQRQREQLLLEELVALVNRRDRLVRDRHRRETRAQEEDEELERSLDPRRRRFGRRETCEIC